MGEGTRKRKTYLTSAGIEQTELGGQTGESRGYYGGNRGKCEREGYK